MFGIGPTDADVAAVVPEGLPAAQVPERLHRRPADRRPTQLESLPEPNRIVQQPVRFAIDARLRAHLVDRLGRRHPDAGQLTTGQHRPVEAGQVVRRHRDPASRDHRLPHSGRVQDQLDRASPRRLDLQGYRTPQLGGREPEVGVRQRQGFEDLLAHQLRQFTPGSAAHHLTEAEAVAEIVVSRAFAGRPLRCPVRQPVGRPTPVGHRRHVGELSARPGRQTGAVLQQVTHRDVLFAVDGELGPPARDRVVHPDGAGLDQLPDQQRDDRFGRRPGPEQIGPLSVRGAVDHQPVVLPDHQLPTSASALGLVEGRPQTLRRNADSHRV